MRRLLQHFFLTLFILVTPLKGFGIDRDLAKSINHTGMFLYYIMDKSHNTIMSPLAISSSLLMAYMGAKGETAHQIAAGLHLTLPQNQVVPAYLSLANHLTEAGKVEISNAMWVDTDAHILSSYQSIVKKGFNGEIQLVNFAKPQIAARKINAWVYDKSHEKIQNFINPSDISSSTRMILLNNLLVKGSWKSPFLTQSTGTHPFTQYDGNTVLCKMMRQVNDFYYFENEDTQVVALEIESLDSHLAFVVFLPRKASDNIYNFYYSQDESKPEGFLTYLSQLRRTSVDVSIPKFITSQKVNLIPLYRALGINSALTRSADFSGIDGTKNLMINKSFQQNVLSIDEGGIFAAAATGTSFSLKSTRPDAEASFVADRPFLYAIYDFDTGLLLFLGECQNPVETGIVEVTGGQSS
ncbi:MAG: serpin family protein [Chlamydiia bacterium]|nr:serpin family protein [Chlamydiia bacterium]